MRKCKLCFSLLTLNIHGTESEFNKPAPTCVMGLQAGELTDAAAYENLAVSVIVRAAAAAAAHVLEADGTANEDSRDSCVRRAISCRS